jgi:hypothetical protein
MMSSTVGSYRFKLWKLKATQAKPSGCKSVWPRSDRGAPQRGHGPQRACSWYEPRLASGSDRLGRVRLRYTTTLKDGERHESDYSIELETSPQTFGGRRWWFLCPRTGRRATKLYLPNGALTFASRQADQLAYASQREQPHDRASRRAFKLRGKLGAEGGIGDFIPKPKWMRWPTYERKLEEIAAAGNDHQWTLSPANRQRDPTS